MLIQEPTSASNHRRRRGGPAPLTTAVLTALFCVVVFLRHDYWNWTDPGYPLFGFLPVGLWWQGLVSILASLMMWAMVRFAWPDHLEDQFLTEPQKQPPSDVPPSPRH